MTLPDWLDQQGPWLTHELAGRGLTTSGIDALVRHGRLIRVRRGSYLSSKQWSKLSPDGQALIRMFAHWKVGAVSGGYAPIYSHTSAVRLHRLFLLNPDPLIHITDRPGASATGHARDVRMHHGWLAASDVTGKHVLLSTSLERTAVDCSRIFEYRAALITTEHALKLGASRERMDAIVASLANHKGVGCARKVLRNASQLSESPGETLALDILRSMSVPMPEQQASVSSRLGGFRLDFAWRERRAALMIGGWARYFDYRLTAAGLLEERRHEEALIELGWTFLRIEWSDLFREAEVKDRILALLRQAGVSRAA